MQDESSSLSTKKTSTPSFKPSIPTFRGKTSNENYDQTIISEQFQIKKRTWHDYSTSYNYEHSTTGLLSLEIKSFNIMVKV